MNATATTATRHRRRMAAWLALAALAVVLVVMTAGPGSFDVRHLLVVAAVVGLVLEAERTQ